MQSPVGTVWFAQWPGAAADLLPPKGPKIGVLRALSILRPAPVGWSGSPGEMPGMAVPVGWVYRVVMVIAAQPPVWVVAVTGQGLYEVRAAGPFASFRAADEFRAEAVGGLSPGEAEKFAVVALESPHHVQAFVSGLGEQG